MRTQSIDTHPETELVLIEMIRKAPISRRFQFLSSLTQSTMSLNMHGLRLLHPDASEREIALHFASSAYEGAFCEQLRAAWEHRKQQQIQPADLLCVMMPAIEALALLDIPSYIGGSVASSLYGMQQMAQDVDVVVDLPEQKIAQFMPLLRHAYLFDESIVQEAVQCQTAFPVIHIDTLMKVDIIPSRSSAFDDHMRHLAVSYTLNERYPPFRIASVYEMLLFKLARYAQDEQTRTDGMVDDAEWNDILGMLKVQRPSLDLALLEHWTGTLDIADVLMRVLVDAGLRDT